MCSAATVQELCCAANSNTPGRYARQHITLSSPFPYITAQRPAMSPLQLCSICSVPSILRIPSLSSNDMECTFEAISSMVMTVAIMQPLLAVPHCVCSISSTSIDVRLERESRACLLIRRFFVACVVSGIAARMRVCELKILIST